MIFAKIAIWWRNFMTIGYENAENCWKWLENAEKCWKLLKILRLLQIAKSCYKFM